MEGMKRTRQLRNNQGSMLSMTVLCIGLVLLACIVGFGFYLILTEQKRGQGQTDQLALGIAKTMNDQDRIGDINQLMIRNRELVYTSRMMLTTCDSSFLAFASPLASSLLNEAVTSNVQIDKERRNQIGLMKKRIADVVDQYNMRVGDQAHLTLPWWKSYDMQVVQINCGSINDVQSNVLHTEIYDDLNDIDLRKKYFQPKSNLYMGNINAKLENPDNAIDFKIASLPAAVERAISPPRLTNPEAFKFANQMFDDGKLVNQSFDQIPSAVQVLGHMDVTMRDDKGTVQVGSTAICTGSEPGLDRP
jgi:hypothetical protein